jgi:hypothetical protein
MLAAGCGGTTRNEGDGTGQVDPTGSGGTSPISGDGGTAGVVDGGTSSTPRLNLQGSPRYFRFVRLTNAQWGASVQQVLKLPKPSGLEAAFQAPIFGATDFTNNELLLDVDARAWEDFQTAAEGLAAQVTVSDEALAAVYPEKDVAGFIETIGRRAYRRPLTDDELTSYTLLFQAAADSGSSSSRSPFLKGATVVIQALLQSPGFLYRSELGPEGEPLSAYEATAKLSLFVRGSSPDDALLDAATTLSSADALEREAASMLEETSATGVMRLFHGELLRLDNLLQIGKVGVPGYDPALNEEYRESSYLFFDEIFQEGRGLRDIFTSTRGFMGPGMATLYGLPSPKSGYVERELGPKRVGYFSQLPYLTLHAHNEAPDPIHRGLGLALDMLCSPLGPPAITIPPLPPLRPDETNRQRVEEMTQGCGGICHNDIMNPLGFAFEHFDGMGRYRDTEGEGLPIDSSASYVFAGGRVEFADNVELMELLANSDEAHLCYAKKLASFALQRDIVESDLPYLTQLAKLSQTDAGSVKDMILAIVRSDTFRIRAGGHP